MKKYISLITSFIFIFTLLLGGCSKKDDGEITYPDTGYIVEIDDSGNTTVYDSDGNVVAGTESGDDIQIQDDGSVVINSSDGTSTTLPAETTSTPTTVTTPPSSETEPVVGKTDTSGMDFDFDDEDTNAETPSNGTTVDVSGNTTQTNSGTNLYNITSGGTYTLTGNITIPTERLRSRAVRIPCPPVMTVSTPIPILQSQDQLLN